MFALIKIIGQDEVYTCDWDETDALPLFDMIKQECEIQANESEKLIINVEVLELANPSRVYESNTPDDYKWSDREARLIDSLVLAYSEVTQSLDLVTTHQIHKVINS